MIGSWIQIEGFGTFYNRDAVAGISGPQQRRRLISVAPFRRPLGPGAESGNCSVTLENGDGALTEAFSTPPLFARATVGVNGTVIASGVVATITMGAEIVVDVNI